MHDLYDDSGDNMSSSRYHGEGTIPTKELRRRQVNILEIYLKRLNTGDRLSRQQLLSHGFAFFFPPFSR